MIGTKGLTIMNKISAIHENSKLIVTEKSTIPTHITIFAQIVPILYQIPKRLNTHLNRWPTATIIGTRCVVTHLKIVTGAKDQ